MKLFLIILSLIYCNKIIYGERNSDFSLVICIVDTVTNTSTPAPYIPPELPDGNNTHMEEDNKPSHFYNETLLDKNDTNKSQYYGSESIVNNIKDKGKKNLGPITLSQDDKNRFYHPWRFPLFIKVYGRRMPHQYLHSKLVNFENPSEQLILIDL